MSDETEEYKGDAVQRMIEAMNQQARDVMVFPPLTCNLVIGKRLTIVFEFLRTPGTALDATIVQLNFEQARIIQDFLNTELGDMTELDVLRTMREPTKERHDDDPETGFVPPASC